MRESCVPTAERTRQWIAQVFAQGVRRPGYPADRWAEGFIAEQFEKLGLERVRREPVELSYWEPREASLRVVGSGESFELPCFPLPHAASCADLELELAPFDPATPEGMEGRAALEDVPLLRMNPTGAVGLSRQVEGTLTPAERILDPRGTFVGAEQVLPFGPRIMEAMEPAIEAGAAAFVGALTDYPGDSFEYYVPYDGIARPIPGVWIRGSDGARLRALLDRGAVRLTLTVDALREPITSYNILGELPGADDEIVVIGSHHDGPWSSAVEDGSGIALVLAQAAYWAALPASERPHRLWFLLNAGHMAGGAGCEAFLEQHRGELERIVLSLHLEHAAREFVERDGELVPSGEPETRWFFTSRIPRLETAVRDTLQAEGVDRALILPPDAFGPRPTTDGGAFHPAGVPLVNYLTAPFYLFDACDRMDKIDDASLEPITRAAIRLIESTRGVSAQALRADAAE